MKIKKYLNLLLNPLKIENISISIKLKFFDLFQEVLGVDDIVKNLNLDKQTTKVFLDSLVQLKLLKYKNNLYRNSSLSNKYFVSDSKYYIGDMFLTKKEYFESSQKNMFDLLKNGYKKDINLQDSKQWVEISKKYFYQEQKAILSDVVVDVVKNLDTSKNIKKILDLGCSSGVLSLELVKKNSNFEAVLFDFKDVIKNTKKNIKKYKLQNRVTTLQGDIQKDDIKDGYDLVICSNILHLLPQKQKVIEKIYNSLNKNGTLLIIQSNFLEELIQDENSYFYNIISMMQNKNYRKNYLFEDMLLKSGFKNTNSFLSDKSTYLNTKIQIAKK